MIRVTSKKRGAVTTTTWLQLILSPANALTSVGLEDSSSLGLALKLEQTQYDDDAKWKNAAPSQIARWEASTHLPLGIKRLTPVIAELQKCCHGLRWKESLQAAAPTNGTLPVWPPAEPSKRNLFIECTRESVAEELEQETLAEKSARALLMYDCRAFGESKEKKDEYRVIQREYAFNNLTITDLMDYAFLAALQQPYISPDVLLFRIGMVLLRRVTPRLFTAVLTWLDIHGIRIDVPESAVWYAIDIEYHIDINVDEWAAVARNIRSTKPELRKGRVSWSFKSLEEADVAMINISDERVQKKLLKRPPYNFEPPVELAGNAFLKELWRFITERPDYCFACKYPKEYPKYAGWHKEEIMERYNRVLALCRTWSAKRKKPPVLT